MCGSWWDFYFLLRRAIYSCTRSIVLCPAEEIVSFWSVQSIKTHRCFKSLKKKESMQTLFWFKWQLSEKRQRDRDTGVNEIAFDCLAMNDGRICPLWEWHAATSSMHWQDKSQPRKTGTMAVILRCTDGYYKPAQEKPLSSVMDGGMLLATGL